MAKAIIFDLDGTLYDSAGLGRRLVLAAPRRARTLAAERRARRALAGRYFPDGGSKAVYDELFRMIAEDREMTTEEVSDWFWNVYMKDMVSILRRRYKARPGLVPVLEALRAEGYRLAVFSDYGAVDAKLRAIGLDPTLFDGLYDAPSMGGLKPCREAFRNVCEDMDIKPSDCYFVGDREDTDGGSVKAGMRFININRK